MSAFDLQQAGYKVFSMLTDNPACRDDDRLLLQQIWMKESKAGCLDEFMVELANGDLSNAESLTRMRRKIQEKHPALRGEKYDSRHKMEGAVCAQLTFFDCW